MYTLAEKIFIVKTYYLVKRDKKLLRSEFQSEFNKVGPTNIQIIRLINKFEISGNIDLAYIRKINNKRSSNLNVVENHFTDNASTSIRIAANTLNMSSSTIHKILRKNLKFKPYRTQTVQLLSNNAKIKRLNFANTFDVSTLTNIWFSDESYFYLNPKASRNSMVWSKTKPLDNFVQKPSHSSKILVWMAISCHGIFWRPVEGTMNTERYSSLLREHFIPYLTSRNLLDESIFMQDGAPCHTSKKAMLLLNEHFKDRVISTRYPEKFNMGIEWPPYSPDLTPLDFCVWAVLKARIAKIKPKSLYELHCALLTEVGQLTQEFVTKTILNIIPRLEALKKNHGAHFEMGL